MEQGKTDWSKVPAEIKGHLGDSLPASVGQARQRPRVIQSCHRQQATRLRFGWTSRARYRPWPQDHVQGNCYAAKTHRPVQFELTEQTRDAVAAWIAKAGLSSEQHLFQSRLKNSPHITTRQYARIVHQWVGAIGLDPAAYGTHTMRRTKATLIYRRTKNLRAVQLLLGHSRLESTVRYLGIEVDDALEISEQTEI